VADIETGQPMTPDLMVSVASVSKLVTAVTTMTFVAEGALSLDEPIRTYMPKLPPRLGGVTLAELLSHTAGLADATPWRPVGLNGSLAPVCAALSDSIFVTEPGEAWGYSNTDYTVVGCVLEAVAAAPFPTVVRQRVFEPLGMTRSTFLALMAMTYPHAQGHDTRGDTPVVVRPFNSGPPVAPAGDLTTTVGDLYKLAQALVSDGKIDGRQAFPSGILTELAKPRGHGGAFLNGTRDYGFGLFSRDHDGLRILEHEGVYPGFGASFALAPERGLIAVAVTNGRYSAPGVTTQASLDLLAGREPRRILAWEDQQRPIAPKDSAALVGSYAGLTRAFRIEAVNGRLSLVMRSGSWPLVGQESDNLEVPGYPGLLPLPASPFEIVRGPEGRVRFVRLSWRLFRRVE
jgi:CubicO group peptidase (beta-lactamase class C family)